MALTSTDTPGAPGTLQLLPQIVGRWATATPDSTAIVFEGRTWTWREWFDRIGRLTACLKAMGVGRGDRVAFLDKNHPACLETTFAAASLGAATVILNWRLSAEEVNYALSDSAAKVLIAGDEFSDLASSALAEGTQVERVVRLSADDTDEYEPLIAASSALGIDRSVEPTDGALVIYSSGTTGRPKGVVLSHTALVAHTVSVGTRFPFEDGDSNLVAMPMFHVGGVCWSFLSIHAGRPGIVVRNPDAPSLLAGLAAGATHAFFVPPVISGLLAGGPTVAEALAGLKFLGYGAAPMPEPLLRTALEAWSHVNFVQVYGQTEISGVAVTLEPADHRDPQRGRLLASAGKPVPGVELRIADPITEQDVPAGQQGEIWVRSAQVMTEYLNRPDATAETVTAEGWLRTGDIGRLDAEGYVYVEDRIKDMIITGGENVYGPEVERVLAEHPHIVDAAVIGVPDPKWGEAVKAVVVVSEPTSAEDVIAFCRERLAGYKCPLSVEFTDTLPRNASGKLLKRDLRAQYWPSADRKI